MRHVPSDFEKTRLAARATQNIMATMVKIILDFLNALALCAMIAIYYYWFREIDRRIGILLKTHRNLLEAMLKASEKKEDADKDVEKPASPYDNRQVEV